MHGDGKERLYHELTQRILTMELEPGVHLDETRLSAEYGISRTPLRDVFRRLQGEGYAESRGRRGMFVAPLTHETLRGFLRTAPMIYVAVARLAAEARGDGRLAELRAAQARFRAAVAAGDVQGMVLWNDAVHLLIGETAENPYLLPSLRRLLIDHARVGRSFWRPMTRAEAARLAAAADQHDAMIAAIEAGDAERAAAVTRAHWALSSEHLERYVRPAPLQEDLESPR